MFELLQVAMSNLAPPMHDKPESEHPTAENQEPRPKQRKPAPWHKLKKN